MILQKCTDHKSMKMTITLYKTRLKLSPATHMTTQLCLPTSTSTITPWFMKMFSTRGVTSSMCIRTSCTPRTLHPHLTPSLQQRLLSYLSATPLLWQGASRLILCQSLRFWWKWQPRCECSFLIFFQGKRISTWNFRVKYHNNAPLCPQLSQPLLWLLRGW